MHIRYCGPEFVSFSSQFLLNVGIICQPFQPDLPALSLSQSLKLLLSPSPYSPVSHKSNPLYNSLNIRNMDSSYDTGYDDILGLTYPVAKTRSDPTLARLISETPTYKNTLMRPAKHSQGWTKAEQRRYDYEVAIKGITKLRQDRNNDVQFLKLTYVMKSVNGQVV
jgi:hypothetical protein